MKLLGMEVAVPGGPRPSPELGRGGGGEGSTAITTSSSGSKTAEIRYMPWGGTRYTYGSTPTSYRYTGQREAEAGLYFYGARFYDPALGRFISPDNVSPRIESNAQETASIRAALMVSYFHPRALSELSELYTRMTFKQPFSGSNSTQSQQSITISQAFDRHTETTYSDSYYQTGDPAQNMGDLGKVEYDHGHGASGNRSRPPRQLPSLPLGINTIAHDRYSYTRNCPTRYIDPTGNTECDIYQAIAGISLVGGGVIIGVFGVGLAGIGVGELTVASPTIIGIFMGFHNLTVGGAMAYLGYLGVRGGVQTVIDSGCIPGLDADT